MYAWVDRFFGGCLLWLMVGCGEKTAPQEVKRSAAKQELVPVRGSLSPLCAEPDWAALEVYQSTMTRGEFEAAYRDIYRDGGFPTATIRWDEGALFVEKVTGSGDWMEIRFSAESGAGVSAGRTWRRVEEMPPLQGRSELHGVRIAIDPGHIGGAWAKMEERWLHVPGYLPVMEGSMTLLVAQKMADRLRKSGAVVSLVRGATEPVTDLRKENLMDIARWMLQQQGVSNPVESSEGLHGPAKLNTVEWVAERLFYRTAEISARTRMINEVIKPDVVLCLHFDAVPWGNAESAIFSDDNHFHVLVNGCYSAGELAMDDVRELMLSRLLGRIHEEEIEMSSIVAREFAVISKLPPLRYPGSTARRVNANPFVWARNLKANREYLAPVVFLEPYVMNHELFVKRCMAGDYEGTREVAGEERISIFEEYVVGVVSGLKRHYQKRR